MKMISEQAVVALVVSMDDAVDVIRRYGSIDGEHHKAWVIDQVARKLMRDEYDEFVASCRMGRDGPNTYTWDVGIPP